MKNNKMNFSNIALKDLDWFDRTEFTAAQIDVIKGSYPVFSDKTFTNPAFTAIEYSGGELCNTDISYCKLAQQLHPCDFFPESTSVPLSEGNPTSEAQTYVTEAPVDSDGALQLSHLKAFILSHNASLYLKPEEGKLFYTVYMEDEGEYKIETKEDLDKLSGALDVLKEMRV